MAGSPAESGSPGDVYHSSDQDESMDTDSEVDDKPEMDGPVGGDMDPDVDSSIVMEISDTEELDDEPARRQSPISGTAGTPDGIVNRTAGLHSPVNGMSDGSLVQDQIERIIQSSTTTNPQSPSKTTILENTRNLDQLIHGLTIPIWQRVLSFVPPQSLGKLLCTSHLFHAILAPEGPKESELQHRFHQEPNFIASDLIWQASRSRFAPSIPKPLKGKSELAMWQLLFGRKCQVCNLEKPVVKARNPVDPWNAGPGDHGLRPVWICAILICGTCLPRRCQQEVSLQLSNTFPSFLIKALPPVFLTQENNWIAQSSLLSQPAPPHLQIQKLYYQPHIDLVLHRFEEVKLLGEATAAEWLKGLDSQCRERIDDSSRWEQWEAKAGMQKLLSMREPTQVFVPMPSTTPGFNTASPSAIPPPFIDQNMPVYHAQGPPPIPMIPPNGHMPFQGYPPPGYPNFAPPPAPMNPQIAQGRPRRSLQEVNEARAARRQEIERRCMLLDPPITARVLSHMQSFQAALQISFPFTDKDWDVLKPRLLSQREAAEAQEAVLAEQLKVIQTTVVQPTVETLLTRDLNSLPENEWEQLQAPVRDMLSKYADEYIEDNWAGGSDLNQEMSIRFAPEVLLGVEGIYRTSIDHPEQNAGPNPPRIPLSLENMKWLYDNKIKSLAEIHQKELFQCSICDSTSRFYGFEGVVQHYAAKHTTVLSLGNIIVNWRSDWPSVPPFHPCPGATFTIMPGFDVVSGKHRSSSTGNAGEYGQHMHASPYPQQGSLMGTSPQSFNYGVSHQAAPFYGKADANNYNAHPGAYSSGPHGFAQHPSYGAPSGHDQGFPAPQVPYMPSSAASDIHRKQLIEMAQISRDLWNATMGVKEMPASIRVHILVHHMSVRFGKKFGTIPDISMFLHGLNENAQMRPIRSLNGLSCKACGLNGHHSISERKSFTLPALVNHFRNTHLGQSYSAPGTPDVDWRTEMVDVPENDVIEGLADSNGMDDRKFTLIAEAFPDIFPSPLPALGIFKETRAKAKAAAIRLENLRALDFAGPSNARQPQRLAAGDVPTRSDSQRTSHERLLSRHSSKSERSSVEPPKEDEYDPSRNTFIGDIVQHSGARRSSGFQKPPNIALPPGIVSLGVVDSNGQPESPYTQGGYADRLLRHHRGPVRRSTDPQTGGGEPQLFQEYPLQHFSIKSNPSDSATVDRFLNDLAPAVAMHQNQNLYSASINTPTNVADKGRDPRDSREAGPRRLDRAVRPSSGDAQYEYSPQRYTETQSDHGSIPVNSDMRYGNQSYINQAHYHGSTLSERRREAFTDQVPQVLPYGYSARDRSRSPRRSIPHEHLNYDPNMPQPPYEARNDVRWRGDSPPRETYYGRRPESGHGTRPAESFVGRDAQGRSVRYVAVPVEEYELQAGRYPAARTPMQEPVTRVARPDELMELGSDGRLYMVDSRGPVRYDGGSFDGGYRDYR